MPPNGSLGKTAGGIIEFHKSHLHVKRKKKLFEKYPLTLEKFCIRVFIISISKRKSCSICLWVRSLSRPEFLHSQSGKRLPFRPAWLKAMCKIIMSTKSKQTVAFSTNGGEVSITGNVIESESHTQNGQRSHLEAKMARGLQCVKCKQNNPKLHKKCANSAFCLTVLQSLGFHGSQLCLQALAMTCRSKRNKSVIETVKILTRKAPQKPPFLLYLLFLFLVHLGHFLSLAASLDETASLAACL